MKRTTASFLTLALLLGGTGLARADLIYTFNPTGPQLSSSSSVSDTEGGLTVTARGYNADATAHNLYRKNGGVDEIGIGLTGTLDNELTLKWSGQDGEKATGIANYLQLDLSNVYKVTGASGAKIQMSSVTSGEAFEVYGSNTLGQLGTALTLPGNNLIAQTSEAALALPNFGTYKYYSVSVYFSGALSSSHAADNVLFSALTIQGTNFDVQPVPEPSTVVCAGIASLLGIGYGWRRRKSATTA